METLASLTIVCFMTMLPTLAIHRWQETLKIEQFLATVEKQLRFAQQQAIVLEETQEVWFFEEQQSFSFPDKLNQSARRTSLAVPEKMTVSGPSKLSFLHSSGNNGRLVKYIFTWTEKKQQLILQFQMGVANIRRKLTIYSGFILIESLVSFSVVCVVAGIFSLTITQLIQQNYQREQQLTRTRLGYEAILFLEQTGDLRFKERIYQGETYRFSLMENEGRRILKVTDSRGAILIGE